MGDTVPSPVGVLSDVSDADTDAQLIAQWLFRHQSPHTRTAYAADVAGFLEFAGNPALRAVTVRHLQAWQTHLTDAMLAPSTVNRKLAGLRSLLTYGHQIGYLPFNVGVAVRPRRTPDRMAERILPERDVLSLLAAAEGTPQGPRNTALLAVLYYTGARVSEACGLRWRDLCLDPPKPVAVYRKGARTRHVGLPQACVKALLRIRPEGWESAGHVFRTRSGRTLGRHEAGQVVRGAARRAGLQAPVSPHWLRHAHAAHALDRGAPAHLVQATLGHASLVTTDRYAHVSAGESSGHVLADVREGWDEARPKPRADAQPALPSRIAPTRIGTERP